MDRSTGKKSLIGIFDRVWVAKFPAGRFMSLYVKFGDAKGYYDLVVRYVEAKSGLVLVEAAGLRSK